MAYFEVGELEKDCLEVMMEDRTGTAVTQQGGKKMVWP